MLKIDKILFSHTLWSILLMARDKKLHKHNTHAIICIFMLYISALQSGQVIRIIKVNWVTFCPGQPGLTHFIKYPGLTQIWHRITCVIIMTLHGDDV